MFENSTGPQIKTILVLSLSEAIKTQSVSHFFSAPRPFAGSSVLKQCPGDNGTQLIKTVQVSCL